MPAPDTSAPLQFSASFPCDPRFHPAVADLGAKVALALAYPEADAREIGLAIRRAFEQAIEQGHGVDGGSVVVEVTLRPGGEALDAVVRCPKGVLLELTRRREL